MFAQPKNLLCKQCGAPRGPSVSAANKGEAADRTDRRHKELQFITGNNKATANTQFPPPSSRGADGSRSTRVHRKESATENEVTQTGSIHADIITRAFTQSLKPSGSVQ